MAEIHNRPKEVTSALYSVLRLYPSGSGGITKNLTGPKTLHIIWDTYMTLVTKYQISPINSYLEKCDEKYLRRTEGRTDRGKTVYPPSPFGERGYTNFVIYE
jgi:hypothetical protein